MDAVLGWVKNYSMVVLLLTVLSQTAAKKEYRKYIQLFIEIVWVITIEEDVKLLARNNGYEVEQTVVCLDGEYGVEEMEITLLEGDGEGILALRDKIAGYYQIGADKIVIKAD